MKAEQWARVGEILELMAEAQLDPNLRADYDVDDELVTWWCVSYRDDKIRRYVGETPLEAAEKAWVGYGGDDEPK